MFDVVFLAVDARLCSDDVIGELLWAPEILRSATGLASTVAGGWEGSVSLTTTASRLLETAPRLADPLGRKKLELDNCINHTQHKKQRENQLRYKEIGVSVHSRQCQKWSTSWTNLPLAITYRISWTQQYKQIFIFFSQKTIGVYSQHKILKCSRSEEAASKEWYIICLT